MSKNRRCPTLVFVSAPGFNHAMFPQMASPHVSNLTCTAPLSRDQVPKTWSARPGLVVSRNAVRARQRRTAFITFSLRYWFRLTSIREMHVAQGYRKAAYDEVRDCSMQVFISHGFGAWQVTVVDLPGRTRKLDLHRIVQCRRGPFFNNIEGLSVENPDLVER